MLIEPFSFVLAVLPLSAYILLIAGIRLSSSPVVTTIGRDTAALAVGISGFMVIGPGELFFPSSAAVTLGAYIWLVLLLFYALSVLLIILSIRPQLVVYGARPEDTLEPLHRAAALIDKEAKIDRNRQQVHLPTIGVRLRVDGSIWVDTSHVTAFETNLSPTFWNRLLGSLRSEMKTITRTRRWGGVGLMACGTTLAAFLLIVVLKTQGQITTGLKEWLWR